MEFITEKNQIESTMTESGRIPKEMLNTNSPSFFDKQPGEFTERLLVTIQEAEKLIGLTAKAIRMRIERNNIPVVRLGRRVFISRKVLNAWSEGIVVHPRIGPIPLTRR